MLGNSLSKSARRPGRDWTVLYYGGGVNNLDENIKEAWQAVEGKELPQNVDTYICHIDQNSVMTDYSLDSQGRAHAESVGRENVNSADPEVLRDFLKAGMKKYPAKHYLVVVSSHGQGAEGVIEDDKTSELMSPRDLEMALKSVQPLNQGRPLDAVLFDACQMASVEMASQLVGTAGVAIASMDNVGQLGYELREVLRSASESEDAKELGEKLVKNNRPQQFESCHSLSAVDLQDLENLQSAIGDLAASLQNLSSSDVDKVRDVVRHCRRNLASPMSQLGNEYLADAILSDEEVDSQLLELWLENEKPGQAVALVDFTNRILEKEELCESNPSLQKAAVRVQKQHDKVVFAHRSADFETNTGGLTIRLPLANEEGPLYTNSPDALAFAQNTRWESAFDYIVPVGREVPRTQTWLEAELNIEP